MFLSSPKNASFNVGLYKTPSARSMNYQPENILKKIVSEKKQSDGHDSMYSMKFSQFRESNPAF